MERVLPKTLDYTDVLPLAVESRARRRTFFPVNGQTFASDGANVIRIDISADSLLDTQHSYLRFTFKAKAQSCGIDYAGGHAFIRRLRIEQSGTVLEDINSYNRLMGAIVLPCQSSDEHHEERTITEGVRGKSQSSTAVAMTDLAMTANAQGGLQGSNLTNNSDAQIAADATWDFCIPLNSGIFNNDKLIPLMLMSAPLTIEIELENGTRAVCWNTGAGTYEISNVRYIANLVEVGQDVAQQLRMVQELSGGVLTLAGQTYRHFTGATTATAGDQIINVPARVKSMKSLFFVNQGDGNDAFGTYDISTGTNNRLTEYQLKIGSVVYPPTPVRCNFGSGAANVVAGVRAEAFMELAKAWGNVGSTKGLGQLGWRNWCLVNNTRPTATVAGTAMVFAPCGLDLEAFQRVAIESGVNTADRSLPISLILNFGTQPSGAQTYDVFVLADALFYINGDGSMSVSV